MMEEQQVSVRLKYGIHTIYMFVDLTEPMSALKNELLTLLRERYPSGLKARMDDLDPTKIPENNEETYIALGTMKAANDPYAGWKQLEYDEKDTAEQAGLKQNAIVAFTFTGEPDQEPLFLVDWPKEDGDEDAESE